MVLLCNLSLSHSLRDGRWKKCFSLLLLFRGRLTLAVSLIFFVPMTFVAKFGILFFPRIHDDNMVFSYVLSSTYDCMCGYSGVSQSASGRAANVSPSLSDTVARFRRENERHIDLIVARNNLLTDYLESNTWNLRWLRQR